MARAFTATVTRVVREGDTELHHDEIVSHYRPARNVVLIGGVDPSTIRARPTPEPADTTDQTPEVTVAQGPVRSARGAGHGAGVYLRRRR